MFNQYILRRHNKKYQALWLTACHCTLPRCFTNKTRTKKITSFNNILRAYTPYKDPFIIVPLDNYCAELTRFTERLAQAQNLKQWTRQVILVKTST